MIGRTTGDIWCGEIYWYSQRYKDSTVTRPNTTDHILLADLRGVIAQYQPDSRTASTGTVTRVEPGALGPRRGPRATPRQRDEPIPQESDPEEARRRAFWDARRGFTLEGESARARRWVRQLASVDLSNLSAEELEVLGWEARVLIWMRHRRENRACPWRRACGKIGPYGDCLAPVSLELLREIQLAVRRLPAALA